MLKQATGVRAINPADVTRVDHLNPVGLLFRNGGDAVPATGSICAERAKALLDELQSGDVLYDIGAGDGFTAVHAGMVAARVIAFECDPTRRARLRENLRLNGLRTVDV